MPVCSDRVTRTLPPSVALPNQVNRGRVALFVDEANLFHAASALRIRVNYTKLLQCATGDSPLAGAFFYTGVKSDKHRQQLQSQMHLRRYQIIPKKILWRKDGSAKANLDVEIALDMFIKALENVYDTAVLISGDGDFTYAIDQVQQQGRRVEIIGLRATTSDRLIAISDDYTDLASIKHQLCQ